MNYLIKLRKRITPTHIIMLGFVLCALLGSFLLSCSIFQKKGTYVSYIDALFVSVSGVCVTGLTTVNIAESFSFSGQIILLLLIQVGGLGVVTFTTLLLAAFAKKLTLSERMLIQNAYNLDTLSGLLSLTMRMVRVTLCIEGIGAFCYATVFIPQFGWKGIWFSIFHAVSAFCNAGIDLLGGNSFCTYAANPVINFTTIFLIIVSGLGFPVYWEFYRVLHPKKESVSGNRTRRLNFHARLVLIITAILIIGGMAVTLLLEYDNPATLGVMSWPQKLMAALFQSVTLRTAGFMTVDQSGFKNASCLAYMILMFIGGSPSGTAGGVKTVTVALLLTSMFAHVRGKKEVVLMGRVIDSEDVKKSSAIVSFSMTILLILTIALLATGCYDFLDALYEMTSAIATVGLSRGMTPELNTVGKLIVILAMYLGRIGPITLALAFNTTPANNAVSYGKGKVSVG